MSLANSNSIAEIRCKKKVMGVRMTEELRKLCLFFLKKSPFDNKNNWYTCPPYLPYHEKFLTAVIGGSVRNSQDILDRILIANSLLDTATSLHFYGEFGLACLHCIGCKVGRVDRTHDNLKEYEVAKEFFV
jgi:hypothetical protein